MIKVLLVAYAQDNGIGPLIRIYRTATYPVLPRETDSIEYQEDWALSGIRYIYICFTHIEICLSSKFAQDEINKLKQLGWVLDLSKLNQNYLIKGE